MFTCFSCARQNWAEKMESIAGNVFDQIAERQNSNTISFVSHSHLQRQKYLCWLLFRHISNFITFLNSDLHVYPLEYMMLLYSKDFTLSMCHFSLTFLHHCVFSNVSSNCVPEKMHIHTGCICLAFLHCAFSNVSSIAYTRGCIATLVAFV